MSLSRFLRFGRCRRSMRRTGRNCHLGSLAGRTDGGTSRRRRRIPARFPCRWRAGVRVLGRGRAPGLHPGGCCADQLTVGGQPTVLRRRGSRRSDGRVRGRSAGDGGWPRSAGPAGWRHATMGSAGPAGPLSVRGPPGTRPEVAVAIMSRGDPPPTVAPPAWPLRHRLPAPRPATALRTLAPLWVRARERRSRRRGRTAPRWTSPLGWRSTSVRRARLTPREAAVPGGVRTVSRPPGLTLQLIPSSTRARAHHRRE
jgi:hypothetical protein